MMADMSGVLDLVWVGRCVSGCVYLYKLRRGHTPLVFHVVRRVACVGVFWATCRLGLVSDSDLEGWHVLASDLLTSWGQLLWRGMFGLDLVGVLGGLRRLPKSQSGLSDWLPMRLR